jgi:HipA-like kinase
MSGFTNPLLARTRDGNYYVVKFRGKARHPRALANELIAARLGRLVGLPIPDYSIVTVSYELIRGNPTLLDGTHQTQPGLYTAGLHFGSRYVGVPGDTIVVDFLPGSLLRAVSNFRAAFWGSLVFDLWTANFDERGTVFSKPTGTKGGRYTAWLIDHELCFAGEKWSLPEVPLPCTYSRRSVYEGVEGLSSFEPFLSRIEQLEPQKISNCMKGIPEEWGGDLKHEAQRLAEQLCDRRKQLRVLIEGTMRILPSLSSSRRAAA